jgi:hypothetical protein
MTLSTSNVQYSTFNVQWLGAEARILNARGAEVMWSRGGMKKGERHE